MSVKQAKKKVKMAENNQVDALVGRLVTHQSELRGNIRSDVCQWAQQNPKSAIELFIESATKYFDQLVLNEYLRPLFEDEEIFIEACDGSQTLAEADDVFTSIDSDLKNWDLNKRGKATDKIPVKIRELIKDGSYAHFFGSLFGASPDGVKIKEFIEQNRENLRRYCLQQHQIKSFCVEHRDKLHKDGYATLFLFEENNNFFVARVYLYSVGTLFVYVDVFGNDDRWLAEDRYRVVVPQLVS